MYQAIPFHRWDGIRTKDIFFNFVCKSMGHPLFRLQRIWLEPIYTLLFSTRKSGSSFSLLLQTKNVRLDCDVYQSFLGKYGYMKPIEERNVFHIESWKGLDFFFLLLICYSFVHCWGAGSTYNIQFPCWSYSFLLQTGTCLSVYGWVFVNYKGHFLCISCLWLIVTIL